MNERKSVAGGAGGETKGRGGPQVRGLWSERVSRNCNWRVCLSCRERSRSAGVVGISICLGLELRH